MATRLPRQIQAQLDAADAALAAQNQPPAPPAPTVPDEPPAPPAPPIVDVAPPTPPVPAPATPPTENWEHKYKVLQGMFNQQKQRLDQAIAKLEDAARPPAPSPTPAPTVPPAPTADPKDVQAFGLDMVEMVQRVTGEILTRAGQVIETRIQGVEQAMQQLQQLVQGTTQTVAATAEDLFFDKLTEQAPRWKEFNEAEAFFLWLNEPDPIYGATRDAALKDAHAKGDAKRAAAVFNAFIATLPAPTAPPPAGSPTPRSAGSPPPAPTPQKPIFTQAEVAAFYRDVARGVYRSNPEGYRQKEDMYNAAMAEGRIM